MSSLQKFHRRTNTITIVSPFTTIGAGSNTIGYWLGDISSNKLIVAPKSTETSLIWGSYGTTRNTTNATNGLPNTNTLAGFGQAAHPAAYYCKNLTSGGYNTWYLPAKDELVTLSTNRAATPFATANGFIGGYFHSSTEFSGSNIWTMSMISPPPLPIFLRSLLHGLLEPFAGPPFKFFLLITINTYSVIMC